MVGHVSDEKTNAMGVLELEAKMLREMLVREQDTIADLRARLDAEAEERRRLTALLSHRDADKPAIATSAPEEHAQTLARKRSWWSWGR